MRKRRTDADRPPSTGYVGDHADKLGHVRPFSHGDDEERPSGADRETYHSPFESVNEAIFPGWRRRWGRRRKRKR
jgi:hypothetical protein